MWFGFGVNNVTHVWTPPHKHLNAHKSVHTTVNPLCSGNFDNSVEPDEMPHYAVFHQGLHCSLRLFNDLLRKKYIFIPKLKPVTPGYLQWTLLILLHIALWKIPLVLKELNVQWLRIWTHTCLEMMIFQSKIPWLEITCNGLNKKRRWLMNDLVNMRLQAITTYNKR